METPAWFNEWLNNTLLQLGPVRPGDWLAVDDSGTIVDEDSNGNLLTERVGIRTDASSIRIVYIFPAVFQ